MSSSPFLFLNREKNISINIFILIQYFKHFYTCINALVFSLTDLLNRSPSQFLREVYSPVNTIHTETSTDVYELFYPQ